MAYKIKYDDKVYDKGSIIPVRSLTGHRFSGHWVGNAKADSIGWWVAMGASMGVLIQATAYREGEQWFKIPKSTWIRALIVGLTFRSHGKLFKRGQLFIVTRPSISSEEIKAGPVQPQTVKDIPWND